MTATALANNSSLAIDPALDFFDDVHEVAPRRPQLRLIEGEGQASHGFARIVPGATPTVSVASVEVYRRRRFLALVAVTALVLSLAWVAGVSVVSFGSTATAATAVEQAPAVHVVLPGDSYAAIAADLGATNPVEAAQQIRAANGGSELVVGQRLVVDVAALALGG